MLKEMWFRGLVCIGTALLFVSCLKHGSLFSGPDPEDLKTPLYVYPFAGENSNVTAEITVETQGNIDLESSDIGIPPLKYDKSWLFLLVQDDCKHAAYSYTWAAINGRPLTEKYYYDFRQYLYDDLPPDTYYLGKTLGSTDGAGNEVRFNFTTTLSPEWDFMNVRSDVRPGFATNYYRFFMKSGLIWDNVIDMMNYGTGIAFHDVNTRDVNHSDSIRIHYQWSQDSILKHLSGRGCKMLAEPNGNKVYVEAAKGYAPIQLMTAQAGTVKLYPFQVKTDLQGLLLHRAFLGVEETKRFISEQLQLKKEEREAISIGVHGTGTSWIEFFKWLNDTYGKEGDDSVWFTSMEEYYEYNYFRIHGRIEKEVNGNTLKIRVSLPAEEYFYYPSVTLKVKGLKKSDIASVSAGAVVKGLSWGEGSDGLIINIDCRKYLLEHATHFVEQYEKNKTDIALREARYFVNMLKDSPQKAALLKRIR